MARCGQATPTAGMPGRCATCARCAMCHRGERVRADYELAGVMHPDGYCGFCGKRWPEPAPRTPPPDPED